MSAYIHVLHMDSALRKLGIDYIMEKDMYDINWENTVSCEKETRVNNLIKERLYNMSGE